jgi:hypothetical protein
VFAAYLAITLLAAAAHVSVGVANLAGNPYAYRQADTMRVPRSWVRPLGVLLTTGGLGLAAGLAVPVLGTLAATGLVAYFVCAFGAHVRVRDRGLGAWSVFFGVSVAALAVGLAYHGLA